MLNDQKYILPGLYKLLDDYLEYDKANLEDLMAKNMRDIGEMPVVRDAAKRATTSQLYGMFVDPYWYETWTTVALDELKKN